MKPIQRSLFAAIAATVCGPAMAQALPNLAVTHCSVSQTSNLMPGQAVTVSYDVRNYGNWGTAQFWGDAVRWNTAPTLAGATTLATLCRNFPSFLGPGQSYSTFNANQPATVNIPSGISGGTYWIGYDANITRSATGPCTPAPWVFFEMALYDNQYWVPVHVDGLPAFAVSAVSASPSLVAPGEFVAVTFTTQNVGGNIGNGSIAAAIFRSPTPQVSGSVLATGQYFVLAARGSITQTINVQIPLTASAGSFFIVVHCAFFGGVGQASTALNVAATPITIGTLATATPFGQGCGGPFEPQLTAVDLPRLGTTLHVDVGNLSPFLPALLMLGSSNTFWPGVGALPLPLAAIGMTGCFALISPDASALLVSSTSMASWSLDIPNLPALVGYSLYAQAIAFAPPGVNPAGLVASSGLEARVGY